MDSSMSATPFENEEDNMIADDMKRLAEEIATAYEQRMDGLNHIREGISRATACRRA